MSSIRTAFPLLAQIESAKELANRIAVQQFEAGRRTGVRETRLRLSPLIGTAGMVGFVFGIVFACLFAETVVRWLA